MMLNMPFMAMGYAQSLLWPRLTLEGETVISPDQNQSHDLGVQNA